MRFFQFIVLMFILSCGEGCAGHSGAGQLGSVDGVYVLAGANVGGVGSVEIGWRATAECHRVFVSLNRLALVSREFCSDGSKNNP